MRLEVALQDGALSARIETETQAVKNLLLDQLPQLRDRLTEHGFRIERFDVDVSQQQSADTPWHSRETDDPRSGGAARRRSGAVATSTAESPASITRLVNAQPGKLNVVI
jgi:flagellar hook-length control protein FliK